MTSLCSFRKSPLLLAATAILAWSPAAFAQLTGSPVNLSTSSTGTITITPTSGSSTVGSGTEFNFCVGPNSDSCASSGLYAWVNVQDNVVSIQFTGGTLPGNGTFTVRLSGLTPTITNVTQTAGSLGGGTFALTSFDAHSMLFTGTTSSSFASGSTYTFAVSAAGGSATPLPATLGLVGTGLGAASLYLFRRRRPKSA